MRDGEQSASGALRGNAGRRRGWLQAGTDTSRCCDSGPGQEDLGERTRIELLGEEDLDEGRADDGINLWPDERPAWEMRLSRGTG